MNSKLENSIAAPVGMILAALATGACGNSSSGTQELRRALNGTLTFSSEPGHTCDESQQQLARASWPYVVDYVYTESARARLVACMKGWIGQGTMDDPPNDLNWPNYSGYPEYVVSRLGDNLPTVLHCIDHTSKIADGAEQVLLNVTPQTPLELAGGLLHEITHTKGFGHLSGGGEGAFGTENGQSPPALVHGCVPVAVPGSDFSHQGVLDMALETNLDLVGQESKTYSPGPGSHRYCDGQTVAAGMYGSTSGSDIVQMGLTCKPRNVDNADLQSGHLGSSGPAPFTLRCNPGEVMVGAFGTAYERVHSVGAICQPETSVAQGTTTGRYRTGSRGAAGTLAWERLCPPFFAVKGMGGKVSTRLSTLELRCQDWRNPQPIESLFLGGAGVWPPNSQAYDERTVGRGILRGIGARIDGGRVSRLGAEYGTISFAGLTASVTAPVFALRSHGHFPDQFSGTNEIRRCGAAQAMVGLHMKWGSDVTAVGPLCADVNAWANGGSPALDRLGAPIGYPGTYEADFVCPARHFMDGWVIEASDRINALQPHCRKFSQACTSNASCPSPYTCSQGSCVQATQVVAGNGHSCALLSDGTVRCWGYNELGELGNGTTVQANSPVKVLGVSTATALSATQDHTCALLADGTSRCWGSNGDGMCGRPPQSPYIFTTAVEVNQLSGATAISAGSNNGCALVTGGVMKCWGNNWSGQLGNGTNISSSTPVPLSGWSGLVKMASGWANAFAIGSDGVLRAWGLNDRGQLGIGSYSNAGSPQPVPGLSGVTAVASGYQHSCAIAGGGSVKCWGSHEFGQLGIGGDYGGTRTTPTDVVGISGAVAISAGLNKSCAVLTDGTVKCWGSQLGNGSNSGSTSPVTVTGLTGATAVASGNNHSCALLSTGKVKCWGANWTGQLGDGTTNARLTPVEVASW